MAPWRLAAIHGCARPLWAIRDGYSSLASLRALLKRQWPQHKQRPQLLAPRHTTSSFSVSAWPMTSTFAILSRPAQFRTRIRMQIKHTESCVLLSQPFRILDTRSPLFYPTIFRQHGCNGIIMLALRHKTIVSDFL